MIRIKKYPIPDKLLEIPENILSIDLGRTVGFAFIQGNYLYCGSTRIKVSEWTINTTSLKDVKSEYEKIINYLFEKFNKFDLVLIEENKFLLTVKQTRRGILAHFAKLDMMVEGIFILIWPAKVKRYFGGWLKKKYFCSGSQSIVQAKIKELLGAKSMSDHATDAIAGLYYMRGKNGYF